MSVARNEAAVLPRVLCVDDEPHVLEALSRTLRKDYSVTVATSAVEAMELLDGSEPFAIVISDQRMPRVDGVTFLAEVRRRSPDSVRVLLTGYADTGAAIRAVNEGEVFRFLSKPAGRAELEHTLADAARHHQMLTAERVLLEETLHGSIKAVTDILALVNPAGFGRALRAKETVAALAQHLEAPDAWRIEIAAMLSQVGSVTLSNSTVHKLYHGLKLTLTESLAVARLPRVAADLVGNIPRMKEVSELLAGMDLRFDGSNGEPGVKEEAIPLGSRMLKVALDFDVLECQGIPPAVAIEALRTREGWYDPALLDALAEVRGAGPPPKVREIELRRVEPGMVLADDVHTETGILLVARGQQATPRMLDRIRSTLSLGSLRQLVRVTFPEPPAPPEEEGEAASVEEGEAAVADANAAPTTCTPSEARAASVENGTTTTSPIEIATDV